MKRIGMILDQRFPPDVRVENEAISLLDKGYKVFLWCYAFSDEPITENYKGMQIERVLASHYWIKKMRGLVNVIPIYDLYLLKKISSFIEKYNIDILHIHDLYLLGTGLKLRKRYGIPVVSDLHENYVEGLKLYNFANRFPGNLLINIKKWERAEKSWLDRTDKIIVVVDEAVERLISIGIDRNKIFPVQNYLNYNEFNRYQVQKEIIQKYQDKFIISYVGAFDHHRGLHILLKGFAELIKKKIPAQLVLVGGGKILGQLKRLANELQISRHVEFTGFQPHESLPSYIEASTIGVIPHIKTGHTDNTLPHKLFQYMYKQKPILVSDCAPLKRIVNECGCGKVYINTDHKSLARQLIWFYENKNMLSEFGKKGKNCLLKKYNWSFAEKNLLNLYEQFGK